LTTIEVVDRDGSTKTVEATVGESLMINLRDNGGVDLAAICGGSASCATCHVYVDEAWRELIGSASDIEIELLEGSVHYMPEASRLSCQVTMTEALNGLRVTVAPEE
jgi:2Fe-2S ferredoxin